MSEAKGIINAHYFVAVDGGKVIFCQNCGAIKFSYYKSKDEMTKEGEFENVKAKCPMSAN